MEHALIIGATKGIGFALAQQLLAQDMRVTLSGRDADGVAAALARLDAPQASGMLLDLRDFEAVRTALAAGDTIDHLVLCGSSDLAWGPFATLTMEALERALHMKLGGYLNALQAALPRLAERASVTLVGGAAARAAWPGTVGLAAVNGALMAATRTLARELAPRRVNLVSPGLTDTEAYDAMPQAAKASLFDGAASRLPVGRAGKAQEAADAIRFVLGNAFVSGAVIDVDGGAHLG